MADIPVTAPVRLYQCKTCERDLDADAFYVSNQSNCKECVRARVRDNRRSKADYYREYDRKRFQDDPRVRQRHRRYQRTERGKQAAKRSRAKWLDANPEKRAAHVLVGNAVRDGRIEKSKSCQECGARSCRIEGHHDDYSKPLEVKWLCRDCHVKAHNSFRGDSDV